MTIYICPYCNKDQSASEPHDMARKLAHENGLTGEMVDPGGRVLFFPFGRVRLGDHCNWCDYEDLRKAINQRENEG